MNTISKCSETTDTPEPVKPGDVYTGNLTGGYFLRTNDNRWIRLKDGTLISYVAGTRLPAGTCIKLIVNEVGT